uniref:Flavin-containing monooxygenase n=1 Tax=Aegilops tauschii subsp. strangulata TaxID=200361 RepID=A0A453IXP6_AEGTS
MAMAQGQAARATREAVPPVSRVAIIGGGISGLAAAKQMAAYDPVVFEATPSVGGVWKHCVYRTTRLQTPRPDYEFSDYSWKNRDDPSFPTHTEIVDYLEGYADEFDLWRYISFGSKVVDIKFLGGAEAGFTELWSGTGKDPLRGKPMWEVGIVTGDSNTVQYYKFEFVVMCTGKYGDVPRMPVFPPGKGPEVFKGTVMHSLDYCKLSEEETVELMRGKKAVVVGYKKSAIDLANECAQANQGEGGQACTMLWCGPCTGWCHPTPSGACRSPCSTPHACLSSSTSGPTKGSSDPSSAAS